MCTSTACTFNNHIYLHTHLTAARASASGRAATPSNSCVANSELTLRFALCDCERISESAKLSTENRKIDEQNTMDMFHEPDMKKHDCWQNKLPSEMLNKHMGRECTFTFRL